MYSRKFPSPQDHERHSLIQFQGITNRVAERRSPAGRARREIWELNAQMGHGPRRLVSGAYTMPPWVPIEVKIDQKWRRAFVLRQADNRGHCLVRVTGTPEAEPIMVPLSTIRLPSRVHRAKRRSETAMQIQVKKPRIEQSGDDEE